MTKIVHGHSNNLGKFSKSILESVTAGEKSQQGWKPPMDFRDWLAIEKGRQKIPTSCNG